MLTFTDIELDQDSYEVRRSGHPVELSPTEFRLLRYLMLSPGRLLTRAQTAAASPNDPHGLRITLTLPAAGPSARNGAAPVPHTVSAPR